MAHTEDSAGSHKRPNYLLVFFGLLLLTLVEVGITYMPLPNGLIVASLLAFMVFKVVLVAMFYMHLRVDSRWFTYIFLIPLPFAALILAALLMGY